MEVSASNVPQKPPVKTGNSDCSQSNQSAGATQVVMTLITSGYLPFGSYNPHVTTPPSAAAIGHVTS